LQICFRFLENQSKFGSNFELSVPVSALRVKSPPLRPLLIFDGDCGFCGFWIRRWQRATGESVEYVPFQNPRIGSQFPEIPRDRFEKSVQLIERDGAVYNGAEAVFRSRAMNPHRRFGLCLYQRVPGFATVAELAYRFVASHRTAFSALTRFFFGTK
jgi:predicted DCC family thiol-disulfide oxidoreductase YuxK